MIVVPDAPVLLKSVMSTENESDHHQAMRLRDALLAGEVEIRVPTLWRYEIGNVLGLKQPRLAEEMMGALVTHDFEEVPLKTDYAVEVLKHMRDVAGVTFYDAAYHVLALRTEGLYLTADKTYVKRARLKKGALRCLRIGRDRDFTGKAKEPAKPMPLKNTDR